MQPKTVAVTEIARHFSEYISRVANRRESFILRRGKQPMAELGPLPVGKQLEELPALLAALPRLSEREAAKFSKDLEAARKDLLNLSEFRE